MWPPGATAEDATDARNDASAELGDSDSDGSDCYERYPPREIILDDFWASSEGGTVGAPTHDDEQTDEGRHRSPDAEGENNESDEDAEVAAVDDSTATAEGRSGGKAVVAQDQRGADEELDPRLQDLDVSCITATEGPRCGQRSCLSAVNAVLCALTEAKSCSNTQEESALRESIRTSTPTEVENLERLRAHLDDGSEFSSACDWEPLERVLALRPRFFLLLQATARQQPDTSQRTAIGPRQGPEVNLGPAWHAWRLAAQKAILSLGTAERARFRLYVELCIQRRLEVASAGDVQEFPSLGGHATAGTTASSTWAPQQGRAAVAAEPDSLPDAQPASLPGPAPADLHSAELFPTLGGGSNAAEQRVTDGPGAGWGRQQRRQELPAAVEAFPTLGGDKGAADEAPKWASARSSAPAAATRAPQGGAAGVSRTAPAAPASPPQADGQDFPSLGGASSAAAAAEIRWGAAASSCSGSVLSHSAAGGRAAAAAPTMSMEDWVKPKAQEPQDAATFDGVEAESFPGLPAGTAPVPAGRSAWGKAAAPSRAAVKAHALKQRRQQELDKRSKEALENIASSKNAAKDPSRAEADDSTPPVELVDLDAMVCINKGKTQEEPVAEASRKKKGVEKKKKVLLNLG